MSTIFDAKDYKFAKIVSGDLQKVMDEIYSIEMAMIRLEPYRRYKSVNALCSAYADARTTLEIQLKRYEEIKANKGKKAVVDPS